MSTTRLSDPNVVDAIAYGLLSQLDEVDEWEEDDLFAIGVRAQVANALVSELRVLHNGAVRRIQDAAEEWMCRSETGLQITAPDEVMRFVMGASRTVAEKAVWELWRVSVDWASAYPRRGRALHPVTGFASTLQVAALAVLTADFITAADYDRFAVLPLQAGRVWVPEQQPLVDQYMRPTRTRQFACCRFWETPNLCKAGAAARTHAVGRTRTIYATTRSRDAAQER